MDQPAPITEATWDESLPTAQEPATWQQKARCFYSPSGALIVDYSTPYEDVPRPDAQAWAAGVVQPGQMMMQEDSYYYTADAMSTNHCASCNRTFASTNAVLQHLRDHAAHQDRPEGYEAAYVLRCQEEGYYPAGVQANWGGQMDYSAMPMPVNGWPVEYAMSGVGEDFQVLAPPSDIYTGSDSGSGLVAEDGYDKPSPMAQPGTPGKGSSTAQHAVASAGRAPAARPARAPRAAFPNRGAPAGGRPAGRAAPPPPKPEDQAAFPPLGGASGSSSPAAAAAKPAASRKWAAAAAASGRKLRADATEYQPCMSPTSGNSSSSGREEAALKSETQSEGAALKSETQSEPHVTTPTTPPKQVALRVSAPVWAPAQPVA